MPDQLIPSVCIDAVFESQPISEAIAQVADCGMGAFEFWGWWDKDLPALANAKREHNLEISACCTHFISLVDPALRDQYLAGLSDSIAAAKSIGTTTLISQVGDFRPGVSRNDQHQSLVDGLKSAAPLLESAGINLVIEPLNETVNHPGYYLVKSDEAFDTVEKVGSPNVKVVYDIYHQQISEGNLIDTIINHIDHIGHFHAAGNPGRNELTRGEIHYPQIFDAIRNTNYKGYVGLEYWPIDDAQTGLREVANWFQ